MYYRLPLELLLQGTQFSYGHEEAVKNHTVDRDGDYIIQIGKVCSFTKKLLSKTPESIGFKVPHGFVMCMDGRDIFFLPSKTVVEVKVYQRSASKKEEKLKNYLASLLLNPNSSKMVDFVPD